MKSRPITIGVSRFAAAAVLFLCAIAPPAGAYASAQDAKCLSGLRLPELPEQPETGAEAIRAIRSFYARYVFGREDSAPGVERCCTEKLRRRLREDYAREYDGDGYALWLFRTGCQDGPSDVSEVTAVEASGADTYTVHFIDRGVEGRRTVRMVRENGAWKFDAVE